MTKLMLWGSQPEKIDRLLLFHDPMLTHTRAIYMLTPGDWTLSGYVTTLHNRRLRPFMANAV
jgi:hypothetical protein